MKKYRFKYHYYKQKGKMSVHFKGQCYITKDIVCHAVTSTKWSKTQPNVVMQGYATNISYETGTDKMIIHK
jgi:hypothetical protein